MKRNQIRHSKSLGSDTRSPSKSPRVLTPQGAGRQQSLSDAIEIAARALAGVVDREIATRLRLQQGRG